MKKIGIIGGSGLEKLNIFNQTEELEINTPYGSPSSTIFSGTLENKHVYILSRHGREHTIPPTQVNNKANISALQQLECDCILASTACGSLRDAIKRGDLVLPDQFIDFTRHRKTSFFEHFEPDNWGHIAMADPFSEKIRQQVLFAAQQLEINIHPSATIITIEGPRFSTRAESKMYRIWGADIVNMSTSPEAALANEAGIPYVAIAMSTDYDAWKRDEEPATWEEIMKVFNNNVEKITRLLIKVLAIL
jgi:5'-methylthioadenosine phosphorylase